MPHIIYAAGDGQHIVWAHKDMTGVQTALESRQHALTYHGCHDEESTYVAVHVGLFWCIGTFRIKNGEYARIVTTPKRAPSLCTQSKSSSRIIAEKTHFISELIKKRSIKISYVCDTDEVNPAEVELAKFSAQ
ncbi:MAG: hypothetical protein K8823_1232 [Cenarchaeum symbiont of Oopsacas minuta]|nr:hypothetical protein [Cenarchaeum symbiont of Oopsacas minuta]